MGSQREAMGSAHVFIGGHDGPLAPAALSGQSPEAPEGARRLRREGLTAKARAER
jgi:hypothetical protein